MIRLEGQLLNCLNRFQESMGGTIMIDKGRVYFIILKICVIIFMIIDIILKYSNDIYFMLIYLSLAIVLIINEFLSDRYLGKFTYKLSILIAIIISGILISKMNSIGANIYIFILLSSILSIPEKKSKIILLTIHVIIYTLSKNIIDILTNSTIGLYWIVIILFTYICYITIGYLFKVNKEERERIEQLNIELQKSNSMLQDYSIKLKELTLSEERNRVAQELHDSMGHSLMGLAMHLDFAENIIENQPGRAKEIVVKCRKMVGESIRNLRETVYELKEEGGDNNLEKEIHALIEGFTVGGRVKININFEKNIERLGPFTKNAIYKTVQEGLTNGVKHGSATEFFIDLRINDNNVIIKVKDNGIGCSNIIQSTGLRGIEDRIEKLGGTVELSSENGFEILARIPIEGREKID